MFASTNREKPGLGLGLYLSRCTNQQPLYTLYTNRRALTTQTQPANESLSTQVRLLMRRVPYPVAIITATDPHVYASSNKDNANDAYRGMTVSSFSTVTLHPEPIVSFNVRRPSETLTALLSSRRFLVHLLAPGGATAALARDFSRGNRHHDTSVITGKEAEFEYVPHDAFPGTSESEGEDKGKGCDILPLLRSKTKTQSADISLETPFVLECALHPNQMEVYDHTIVLGRVVRTIIPQQQQQSEDRDNSLCLTYADTRFWGMGSEIKDS